MDKDSPPPLCYGGKVHKRDKEFCRKKRPRLARECALAHSFLLLKNMEIRLKKLTLEFVLKYLYMDSEKFRITIQPSVRIVTS